MQIAQHDDPQILGRNAGHPQRGEFGDGVVFAIAGAGGKGGERRAPDVDLAVLSHVARRLDRQIDGAIDLAKAGAALAGPCSVHDGKELQGGRGYAALAVAVAKRELHHIVFELALDAVPFFREAAAGQSCRKQPERFGRLADHIRACPARSSVPAFRLAAGPKQTRPKARTTARQVRVSIESTHPTPLRPGIDGACLPRVTGSFCRG